jgi:hypothetical protein
MEGKNKNRYRFSEYDIEKLTHYDTLNDSEQEYFACVPKTCLYSFRN